MPKIYFIPLLFLVIISSAQNNREVDSLQKVLTEKLSNAKRAMDSVKNPVKYARTIEDFLSAEFPQRPGLDGRWVYFKNKAEITEVKKPVITSLIPSYKIFHATLINYLGYHTNPGTCSIFWDTTNTKSIYAEPLWYGEISAPLVKLFIGRKFNTRDSLANFLKELNEIMEIGSVYRFRPTFVSDTILKYDLGYFKNTGYTTGGNGSSSTINYNEDGVWRKIIIEIRDFAIVRYTSINPAVNAKKVIE